MNLEIEKVLFNFDQVLFFCFFPVRLHFVYSWLVDDKRFCVVLFWYVELNGSTRESQQIVVR